MSGVLVPKPVLGRQLRVGHRMSRGLVGLWLFNEGSGNRVFDLSGNGASTSQTGDPIWVPGRYGFARQYDGDDKDVAPAAKTPIATTEVTAIVWFKQTATGSFDSPFARWHSFVGSRTQWAFTIESADSNKAKFVVGDGSAFPTATGLAINLDQDYFVAGVYRKDGGVGGGVKIYIDGVLVDSQAGNITMSDSSLNVEIGNLQNNTINYGFVGNIDMAILYNRALSASDVALLYLKPFIMFEEGI